MVNKFIGVLVLLLLVSIGLFAFYYDSGNDSSKKGTLTNNTAIVEDKTVETKVKAETAKTEIAKAQARATTKSCIEKEQDRAVEPKQYTEVDCELLALRFGSKCSEPEALYSEMAQLKKIVRTEELKELALELTSMRLREFKNYAHWADFSYQSDSDERNPVRVFFYNYESYYNTNAHRDNHQQDIRDALEFYHGKNDTVANPKAAEFVLKQLRQRNKEQIDFLLDRLLASGELDITF